MVYHEQLASSSSHIAIHTAPSPEHSSRAAAVTNTIKTKKKTEKNILALAFAFANTIRMALYMLGTLKANRDYVRVCLSFHLVSVRFVFENVVCSTEWTTAVAAATAAASMANIVCNTHGNAHIPHSAI